MIITMRDVRAAKFCRKGAKEFCDNNNIDWSRFLREGIDHKELEKYEDSMINRIIEKALEHG